MICGDPSGEQIECGQGVYVPCMYVETGYAFIRFVVTANTHIYVGSLHVQ